MEKNNEELVSLLLTKEIEIKELLLYIKQIESTYNSLALSYNELLEKHYRKTKRTLIGYKRKDQS